MRILRWLNLQLFGEGDGSTGGEGGNSVTNSDGDGQAALRALGVPEEKLKGRKFNLPKQTEQGQVDSANAGNPAAPEGASKPPGAAPAKASWDDLMEDPEYNRAMQNTVQAAIRKNKGAAENLGKLAPAIELMCRKYGLDPENPDYDALNTAVSGDGSYYEELALEMGVPVATAMQIDQKNRDDARNQRIEAANLEEQRLMKHFNSMVSQGEQLKALYPGFDLQTELQNPQFMRLTSPDMPFSVQDAYEIVHREELNQARTQAAVQITQQQMSNAIRSGSMRPVENGTGSKAPSQAKPMSMDQLSHAQQMDLIRRTRELAQATGKRVIPGVDIPWTV